MDWRISFDNDVIAERYGRSMKGTARSAAEMCEADNSRVSAVAVRKTSNDGWYEESVTFSEWAVLLRVFGDLEQSIYLILERVCDGYLESVYHAECLQQNSPGITDAIPPEDLEEMDADLEDALDDMAGDPLDMLEALLDPEEYLRKMDERLTIWGQDTAELDPAELWKGFGI